MADGTTMPAVHGFMICPIVLCFIVATALLSAAALVFAACDPYRGLTRRCTLAAIAGLHVTKIAGSLAIAAVGAGAGMDVLDADAAATPASRLMLIGIAICGSFMLTLLAQTVSRLALVLGSRVWYAIASPIMLRAVAPPCCVARRGTSRIDVGPYRLLTRAHGLRAPPHAP